MDSAAARHVMVRQLEGRGIAYKAVLDAMERVPREHFVDAAYQAEAYEDSPLPIAHGQTISQPFIVAAMIEAACVGPSSRVLEVGTGSGYAAAVLAEIAGEVFSIERHCDMLESARTRLVRLGYPNVRLRAADGHQGWPQAAPFDAILVAAATRNVPPALKLQLRLGGRLIIPLEEQSGEQALYRITREIENSYLTEMLYRVRFVPLVHGLAAELPAELP